MRFVVSPRNGHVNFSEMDAESRRGDSPTAIEEAGSAAICGDALIAAARANVDIGQNPPRLQFFDLVLSQMHSNCRIAAHGLLPNDAHAPERIAYDCQYDDAHGNQELIKSET